jgi:hypothetical protein
MRNFQFGKPPGSEKFDNGLTHTKQRALINLGCSPGIFDVLSFAFLGKPIGFLDALDFFCTPVTF